MKKGILYLGLFLCAYSCTKSERHSTQLVTKSENTAVKSIVTDTATINGIHFELIDNKGIAELQVKSGYTNIEGKIKMTPPCYFVRYDHKLRIHQYTDIGILASIMILGDPLQSKNDSGKKIFCGKTLQGITLKNDNKIRISTRVINAGQFCLDSWVDEKEFSSFATEPN